MTSREAKYQSPKQLSRRKLILEKTRELIGKKGLENLTMLELAEASNVAERTLYNIYGNRDALVAHALDEFFVNQNQQLIEIDDGIDPLEKILIMAKNDEQEILREPDFSRASMAMYFNTRPSNPIFERQYCLASKNFETLLNQLKDQNGIHDWANTLLIGEEIADRYAGIAVLWLRNIVPDNALFDRLAYCALASIASVATTEYKDRVHKKLKFYTDRLASKGLELPKIFED